MPSFRVLRSSMLDHVAPLVVDDVRHARAGARRVVVGHAEHLLAAGAPSGLRAQDVERVHRAVAAQQPVDVQQRLPAVVRRRSCARPRFSRTCVRDVLPHRSRLQPTRVFSSTPYAARAPAPRACRADRGAPGSGACSGRHLGDRAGALQLAQQRLRRRDRREHDEVGVDHDLEAELGDLVGRQERRLAAGAPCCRASACRSASGLARAAPSCAAPRRRSCRRRPPRSAWRAPCARSKPSTAYASVRAMITKSWSWRASTAALILPPSPPPGSASCRRSGRSAWATAGPRCGSPATPARS